MAKAFIQLVVLLFVLLVVAFTYLLFNYERPRDTFADDLQMPIGINVVNPYAWPPNASPAVDQFRNHLIDVIARQEPHSEEVEVDLQHLAAAKREASGLLHRYLSTHPAWRHTDPYYKRANYHQRTAYRRLTKEGHWYSIEQKITIPYYSLNLEEDHSCRFALGMKWGTLGTHYKYWSTFANNGDSVVPEYYRHTADHNTFCQFKADEELTFFVGEVSNYMPRHLTIASMEFVEQEMEALMKCSDWQSLKQLVGEANFKRGPIEMKLFEAPEPAGAYSIRTWVNPGEKGAIYLKAFEVTTNTELAHHHLKPETFEFVGWSEDEQEKFFANSTFSIHEGAPGKPYAARFEIWFIPADGGVERKLHEQIYQIEGIDSGRG